MKLLYKIKFDILISAKTLFFIKTSYNVPLRNESISQSKICKKHYFALSLPILADMLPLAAKNKNSYQNRGFYLFEPSQKSLPNFFSHHKTISKNHY